MSRTTFETPPSSPRDVLSGACGAILLIVRPPLPLIVALTVMSYCAAGAFVLVMLAPRGNRTVEGRLAERKATHALALRRAQEAAAGVHAGEVDARVAGKIVTVLQRLQDSQINHLLQPDIGLTGSDFERPLHEVFTFRGYPVEHCANREIKGLT